MVIYKPNADVNDKRNTGGVQEQKKGSTTVYKRRLDFTLFFRPQMQ